MAKEPQKPPKPEKPKDQSEWELEHPVGDAELNEEAGRKYSTPTMDRRKTPGRTFDV